MDWLGDVGGLYDALKLLASVVVGLSQSKLLQIKLVTSIFSREPRQFANITTDTEVIKAAQKV